MSSLIVGLGSPPTTTGTSLEQNRKKKQKKQLENTHETIQKTQNNSLFLKFFEPKVAARPSTRRQANRALWTSTKKEREKFFIHNSIPLLLFFFFCSLPLLPFVSLSLSVCVCVCVCLNPFMLLVEVIIDSLHLSVLRFNARCHFACLCFYGSHVHSNSNFPPSIKV